MPCFRFTEKQPKTASRFTKAAYYARCEHGCGGYRVDFWVFTWTFAQVPYRVEARRQEQPCTPWDVADGNLLDGAGVYRRHTPFAGNLWAFSGKRAGQRAKLRKSLARVPGQEHESMRPNLRDRQTRGTRSPLLQLAQNLTACLGDGFSRALTPRTSNKAIASQFM